MRISKLLKKALHLLRRLKCWKCIVWNCCYIVVVQESRVKANYSCGSFVCMIHIHTATYIVEDSTIPSKVAADILSIVLYWRFLHAYKAWEFCTQHGVLNNSLTTSLVWWCWTGGQVILSTDSLQDFWILKERWYSSYTTCSSGDLTVHSVLYLWKNCLPQFGKCDYWRNPWKCSE